jgi:cbb3-type cytochrome oxidase subunit 1
MKPSSSGKIIHFYFVSGRRIMKIFGIIGVLLAISIALVLSVPEFALHQPNFEISSNPALAIAQVLVGIVLLGSLFSGAAFGIFVLFWFFPEIICEVALKKRTLKILRARKTVSLSALAEEIGVYESDLEILLSHWVKAYNKFRLDPAKETLSGNHLNINSVNKEISWEE